MIEGSKHVQLHIWLWWVSAKTVIWIHASFQNCLKTAMSSLLSLPDPGWFGGVLTSVLLPFWLHNMQKHNFCLKNILKYFLNLWQRTSQLLIPSNHTSTTVFEFKLNWHYIFLHFASWYINIYLYFGADFSLLCGGQLSINGMKSPYTSRMLGNFCSYWGNNLFDLFRTNNKA
jgi:hypothetical protein